MSFVDHISSDYSKTSKMPRRRLAKDVSIGKVQIGGYHRIASQSMTSTPTSDVVGTVEQIIELVNSGCDIVRVTVQGIKESQACEKIKDLLVSQGYDVPLVADIHFFPTAALYVADFVEKIRINPGNFVDKRNLTAKIDENYDDERYEKELAKIEVKLLPLIEKCKKYNRAIRIGVNHGSLSERIMQRYGDTIEGMVASALEFAAVFRKYDFNNLVYSMKSSNPKVMIDAYRLLVKETDAKGWNYPLHLGVTEAGAGLAGRVKSSIGIGTLLTEGLGDTVRVSLTENPVNEIVPCQQLVAFAEKYCDFSPFYPNIKRNSEQITGFQHYSLVIRLTKDELESENLWEDLGFAKSNRPTLSEQTPDILIVAPELRSQPQVQLLEKSGLLILSDEGTVTSYPEGSLKTISEQYAVWSPHFPHIDNSRSFLFKESIQNKEVILKISYESGDYENIIIKTATEFGALLNESLYFLIYPDTPSLSVKDRRLLGLTILQGTRKRLFEADFISCPSCGRTLFDIQEVTERIRKKTVHLKKLKIAVMGCIVNGPGEMADADFGFVGSKPGKVDLYIKHNRVIRDIDMELADAALIDLIKKQGQWVEAEV